jgi:hypothetical protein
MDGDKCFKAGIWGSIVAAICCFTPVLVVFGLRFISSFGIIPDPYFLRLAAAEEKLLTGLDS